MGISDADLDAVRAATDLVALIGQHTEVKRSGRSWMARCPIHGERTPSLSISVEKGVWYCFGCQRHGDAITFVREIEGLDFVAAVEHLAARAGIVVEQTAGGDRDRSRRRYLLDMIDTAAGFYHTALLGSVGGGDARQYLTDRGIGTDTVKQYQIGWASTGWDRLVRHLDASQDDAVDAGLGRVSAKSGKLLDFFHSRIVFPVRDERGAVVGFGGRVLPGGDGPKYMNTPAACRVYNKSRVLYGLFEHRREIVKTAETVVCEGYTDVIGCAVAGVANAVAPCGTALTEDHVKLLKRFSAQRLVLAFDADAAGAAAASRLHEWEAVHSVRMTVAQLPDGSDPGSLAQTDPARLTEAVAEPVEMLRWQVERSLAAADLSSIGSRASAASTAAKIVSGHPDPMVRDPFLAEIAQRCTVDVVHLRTGSGRGTARPNVDTGNAGRDGPQFDDDPAGDDAGMPISETEAEAVRLALHHSDLVAGWLRTELFCDPVCAEAFTALRAAGGDAAAACAETAPAAGRLLARLAADGAGPASPTDVEGVMAGVARLAAQRALRAMVADAGAANDPATARHLAECVAWLKQRVDLLAAHTASRGDALREILPWLVEHRAARVAGPVG